jgi:hypothetical protein
MNIPYFLLGLREIGSEEYQRKKAKLLNEKQALKEKLGVSSTVGGGLNAATPYK